MRSHLLSLFVLFIASACSNIPDSTPPPAPPVTHLGNWFWIASTSADGAQNIEQPQRYQIEFVDDGSLRVQADCNRGGSRYSILSESQLQIAPIALSKRACPDDSQDRLFVRQLAGVTKMTLNGQQLRLESANGAEVMHFARDPNAKM